MVRQARYAIPPGREEEVMDSVTVFLRTELFAFGHTDSHVPNGVMVIDGRVVRRTTVVRIDDRVPVPIEVR